MGDTSWVVAVSGMEAGKKVKASTDEGKPAFDEATADTTGEVTKVFER